MRDTMQCNCQRSHDEVIVKHAAEADVQALVDEMRMTGNVMRMTGNVPHRTLIYT